MGSLDLFMMFAASLLAYGDAITGMIEQPDGTPAENAKVIAFSEYPRSIGESQVVTVTDSNGRFVLQRIPRAPEPAHWGILAIAGKNYGEFPETLLIPGKNSEQVPSTTKTENVVVRMKPGRLISGTVYDRHTQQPIAMARIHSKQGQLVRTMKDGAFQLHGVPPRVETLIVVGPGMASTQINVDLCHRESAKIRIELDKGATLEGQVVDEANQPVPHARIQASASSRWIPRSTVVFSNESGHFEFPGVPVHQLLLPLLLNAPGYAERNDDMFVVRHSNHSLPLKLRMAKGGHDVPALRAALGGGDDPPSGLIRGRVVDSQGKPIQQFSVLLKRSRTRWLEEMGGWSGNNRIRHFTEADGQFVIGDLEANKKYRVAIQPQGYREVDLENLTAYPPDHPASNNVAQFTASDRPTTPQFRLLDADSRKPIADAQVGISDRDWPNQEFEWNYRLSGSRIEWTQRDGLVEFPGTVVTDGLIFVDSPGYARHQQFWKLPTGEQAIQESEDDRLPIQEILLAKESRLLVRLNKIGNRSLRGIHLETISPVQGQAVYSSAKAGEPATIQIDQLSPGKLTLRLMDGNSESPWEPLETREIQLAPGDNLLDF